MRKLKMCKQTLNNIISHSGLDCCDPCGHSYGYYKDNMIPKSCDEKEQSCDSNHRCCRGPVVEGCGCPNGTYDDGNKCQEFNTSVTVPCSSSVIIPSTTVMVSSTSPISSSIYSSAPTTSSQLSSSINPSSSVPVSSQATSTAVSYTHLTLPTIYTV